MKITMKDIFRPLFGFIVLQPMIIVWFMLFTNNWEHMYFNEFGWTLQVAITVYMIPVYAFYERFFVSKVVEMKW